MRTFYFSLCVMMALLVSATSRAQVDPHYSQYYVNPLWLNPALTGVMDGDYRVTGIYRNQWNGIGNAFSTPGVSADINTGNNFALGVNLMNQQAGSAGYNYLNGYLSMAYTGVRFGPSGNHRISMGLSLGVLNRRFDQSKFQTGDQWLPGGGLSGGSSTDVLTKSSGTAFDAGAGFVYFDATPGKKANVFIGFSAFHLTQPSDPFISGGYDEKLPIRYTAHGGVKLSLSEDVSITPNLLYMRQGVSEEKMAGAYAQLKVNETSDFLLGANYRIKDAISPYLGVYYKSFVVGLSYDVSTSDLGKAAGKANSFEISLSFTGRKSSHADAIPFVCPRL